MSVQQSQQWREGGWVWATWWEVVVRESRTSKQMGRFWKKRKRSKPWETLMIRLRTETCGETHCKLYMMPGALGRMQDVRVYSLTYTDCNIMFQHHLSASETGNCQGNRRSFPNAQWGTTTNQQSWAACKCGANVSTSSNPSFTVSLSIDAGFVDLVRNLICF